MGLSAIPPQTRWDAAEADSGTSSLVPYAAQPGFEDDLTRWLAHLYAIRAERFGMRCLERLYGAGWLAVTAATLAALAMPLFGRVAALAATFMLLAMLGMACRAATRLDPAHIGHVDRVSKRAPISSTDLPLIGPEERARLIRLMNLSRTAWRPATRMLLRAEWREARSSGRLASWRPMYDLEDVVLGNPFARATSGE